MANRNNGNFQQKSQKILKAITPQVNKQKIQTTKTTISNPSWIKDFMPGGYDHVNKK